MTDEAQERSNDPTQAHRPSSNASKPRTMADLLFLPEVERSLMNWLLRQKQATLADIAAHLNQPESTAETVLNQLIDQGFIKPVDQENTCYYQPNLLSRKGRSVPTNIWDALE